VADKRHGGKDRTPQIDRRDVQCEHSAAVRTSGDVQIMLVERMQSIGAKIKPHIVGLETLVELNPDLICALICAPVRTEE
jgi:hypothetical protein